MKPPSGFESANPELVIGKHLIDSLFIITKQCTKRLKYKLNMINKVYLHPTRTSDYSNSVSSCHVLTYPPPSNKNRPHSKLKDSSRNIFQLSLLSSGNFYFPHTTVLKLFKLASTEDRIV